MLKRSLTILLILIVTIIPAMSFAADAAPEVAAFETPQPDSSQKPVYQDPAQQPAGNSANPMKDNSQQLLLQTINGLSSYYSNYLKNQGVDWVANTDFSLSFNNLWLWNNPTFRATSLQPFKRTFSFEDKSLPFWQVSAAYENTSFTGNLGIGYRGLNESRTQMYGVNLFYDALWANNTYQAPNGYSNYKAADSTPVHQRVGVGLEYFLYSLELRANGYYAVSSDQLLGTAYQINDSANTTTPWNFYERAANGYDVSLSYQLPYMPWLKANVAGYQYFTNSAAGSSTQEQAYRGSLNGLYVGGTIQVSPRLAIDGGYDNGGTGSGFVKATYNMLAMPQPSLFWADETINDYSKYNVSNKMLNKVQRNNNITTVTYAKNGTASSLGGSVTVVVTDYSGNPQKNVPVTLTNTDYTATIQDQTGNDGTVTFTGLPTKDNPNPQNLNARIAAAMAAAGTSTGTSADKSYSYMAMVNLKKIVTPAGGPAYYEDTNNLFTFTLNSCGNAYSIPVTSDPQPDKSKDNPTPPPNPPQPGTTTITVTVVREDGTPVIYDQSQGTGNVFWSVVAAAATINADSGTAQQISADDIVCTQGSNKFTLYASGGSTNTNYGSGQYGISVQIPDSSTPGGNLYVGAQTNVAVCSQNASKDYPLTITLKNTTDQKIKKLTVNYTDKSGKATGIITKNNKNYNVQIAAATAIDISDPLKNATVMNTDSNGVAIFSQAIPYLADQLAVLAFYDKNQGGSNPEYVILGGDPSITIANADTEYTSNIKQFPFDLQ